MSAGETVYSINGRIVPEAQAVVPVTDRGFLYGDGVFETMHVYGRTVFQADEHFDRMDAGFETLAIAGTPTRKTRIKWLRDAVDACDASEANVRFTVTRGSGPRGPSIRGADQPFCLITVTPYKRRPERDYTQGVSAILSTVRRQESSVTAHLKTTAYIEQVFARREADEAGADEALLLNSSGLLCEGSSSNLSIVRGGEILVPDPLLVGALPGTMQKNALRLAESLNIPVRQVGLGPWDLRDPDEAFLSGSLREITPLVQVDGKVVGGGKPGPITRRLIAAYRTYVEKNCPGYRFPKR